MVNQDRQYVYEDILSNDPSYDGFHLDDPTLYGAPVPHTPFEEPKPCADDAPLGAVHQLPRACIQLGPDVWLTQDDPCMPPMYWARQTAEIDGEVYDCAEPESRKATAEEIALGCQLVEHEIWAEALEVGAEGVIEATAFDASPVLVLRRPQGKHWQLVAIFEESREDLVVAPFYGALLDVGILAEQLHVKVIAGQLRQRQRDEKRSDAPRIHERRERAMRRRSQGFRRLPAHTHHVGWWRRGRRSIRPQAA